MTPLPPTPTTGIDVVKILDVMTAALDAARLEESDARAAVAHAREKQREAIRAAATEVKDDPNLSVEFARYAFWNVTEAGSGGLAKALGLKVLDLARIASEGLRCTGCGRAPDPASTRDMRRILQFRLVRLDSKGMDTDYLCRICKPGLGDEGFEGRVRHQSPEESDAYDGADI